MTSIDEVVQVGLVKIISSYYHAWIPNDFILKLFSVLKREFVVFYPRGNTSSV